MLMVIGVIAFASIISTNARPVSAAAVQMSGLNGTTVTLRVIDSALTIKLSVGADQARAEAFVNEHRDVLLDSPPKAVGNDYWFMIVSQSVSIDSAVRNLAALSEVVWS